MNTMLKGTAKMKKSLIPLLLLLNLLAIFLHMIWNERGLAFQILEKIHMETGSVLREMELKCSDVLKNKEEI